MVAPFGVVALPSLTSIHGLGRAVDMTISWNRDLVIKDANSEPTKIVTAPRSGMNTELFEVRKIFGVVKAKYPGDPPHWSDNGK